MTQFYFVLTNPDAEGLLKMEMTSRYPELKMSYSRPGFITYKSPLPVDFRPYMARLSGLCLGKFKAEEITQDKFWFWKREDYQEVPEKFQQISDSSLYKIGEKVTTVMMVGKDEYWVGEYKLLPTHFQTPGEVSSIPVRTVPSRAYYKIAEAAEAFDLEFDHEEVVLELGSAPGGASLFLLENDLRVIGVDPAEMDPVVAGKFNFRHWKCAFETLRKEDFKDNVDWIVSDINLPPTVVLAQVNRLLGFLNPKGMVLTLKFTDEKHLKLLVNVVDTFRRQGWRKTELKYLPSHKKEIALVVF